MVSSDNSVYECGMGEWYVQLYNPSKEIGPFSGFLTTTKEFHRVFARTANGEKGKCILSIPSQNVSYAADKQLLMQKMAEQAKQRA